MQEDWNIILTVLESSDTSLVGEQKVFSSSPIALGRADTNDFVIPDPAASRNHATIRITNDYTRVFITDTSTYGTVVDGTVVPKGPGSGFTLENGATITIGNTVLKYELKLKSSVQATFVGKMDRHFLDTPSPDTKNTVPEKTPEPEMPAEPEESSAGQNPLYIGIIVVCILLLIYLMFFSGN